MEIDYILESFIVIGAVAFWMIISSAVGIVIEKLTKLFPRFGRLMDKLGGEEDV